MAKPIVVVRKAEAMRYIPFSLSSFDDLIAEGKLEAVPLSENGRAIGITLRSIIKYQTEVMGLAPSDDDAPDTE